MSQEIWCWRRHPAEVIISSHHYHRFLKHLITQALRKGKGALWAKFDFSRKNQSEKLYTTTHTNTHDSLDCNLNVRENIIVLWEGDANRPNDAQMAFTLKDEASASPNFLSSGCMLCSWIACIVLFPRFFHITKTRTCCFTLYASDINVCTMQNNVFLKIEF